MSSTYSIGSICQRGTVSEVKGSTEIFEFLLAPDSETRWLRSSESHRRLWKKNTQKKHPGKLNLPDIEARETEVRLSVCACGVAFAAVPASAASSGTGTPGQSPVKEKQSKMLPASKVHHLVGKTAASGPFPSAMMGVLVKCAAKVYIPCQLHGRCQSFPTIVI